ncbi:metal-dependent hydrolase [Krasilnikovia sp. MM14-A1259]|uniref:metal-dependent hydrolase n=1 Tax=Krasilnikovia sp. MM14-A1259 TaxID=3373539 RepID=UPI00381B4F58
MLGTTHALTAATGTLTACTLTTLAGHPPTAKTLILGTLITAGAAYLPDIDHPNSTATRLLGPLTRTLHWATTAGCTAVHRHTRATADPRTTDGHRTLTHTIPAALTAGAITAAACALAGKPAALTVLFLTIALVARSILPTRRGITALLLAALITAVAGATVSDCNWTWLGAAITWGWLSHCLTDALTTAGAPLLWPLPIHGRRWHPIAPPWKLTTGSTCERWIITPTLALTAAALTYHLY